MTRDHRLRHDPARRHAGRGHVALGRGEGARRARPRRARRPDDRGRLPASNPKEVELFERLRGARPAAPTSRAFGMTRRRDVAADEDPALRVLADSFAPVCTIVGKTWSLHLEKVVRGRPRGEPGDDRRLRRLPGAEGKRVVYDAEHFFDGCRDDPDYALACLRAARRGRRRELVAVRHQRRLAAARDRRGDRTRSRRGAAGRARSASTATTTPSAASQLARRGRRGRHAWSRAR